MTDKPYRRHRAGTDSTDNSSYSFHNNGSRYDRKNTSNSKPQSPMGTRKPDGAAEALIELDRDLMKLLVRRAKYVSRLRQGRDHAASPESVMGEKAVRKAWETGAVAFSRDPKFARNLFDLLQEISVLAKNDTQASSFSLSPATKPAAVLITGTPSSLAARMWICLAARIGQKLTLAPVPAPDVLSSCIKTCVQAGAEASLDVPATGMGTASVKAGSPACGIKKTIFFGDDLFALYFFSLACLNTTGTMRLTGSGAAKEADLSSLRHFFPSLGARFAHLVPRSTGLPASIESSGALPASVAIPADMPFEGICAFLLAPLTWGTHFSLNLEALPADMATAALAEVEDIFRFSESSIEIRGGSITYLPNKPTLPELPALFLDAHVNAYSLAVPAFVGGSVSLKGQWPAHRPDAIATEALFRWAGLDITFDNCAVTAISASIEPDKRNEGECIPFTSTNLTRLDSCTVPNDLIPLALAFAAAHAVASPDHEACLPLGLLDDSQTKNIAESMLSTLGFECDGNSIHVPKQRTDNIKTPWFCPNAFWGMGYALCSFLRPGLKLVNPVDISSVHPLFWAFYNGLPMPKDPAELSVPEEPIKPASTRRRIIAD